MPKPIIKTTANFSTERPNQPPTCVGEVICDRPTVRHIPWDPSPSTLIIKNPKWNSWQARGIARMMPGFKVRAVR